MRRSRKTPQGTGARTCGRDRKEGTASWQHNTCEVRPERKPHTAFPSAFLQPCAQTTTTAMPGPLRRWRRRCSSSDHHYSAASAPLRACGGEGGLPAQPRNGLVRLCPPTGAQGRVGFCLMMKPSARSRSAILVGGADGFGTLGGLEPPCTTKVTGCSSRSTMLFVPPLCTAEVLLRYCCCESISLHLARLSLLRYSLDTLREKKIPDGAGIRFPTLGFTPATQVANPYYYYVFD